MQQPWTVLDVQQRQQGALRLNSTLSCSQTQSPNAETQRGGGTCTAQLSASHARACRAPVLCFLARLSFCRHSILATIRSCRGPPMAEGGLEGCTCKGRGKDVGRCTPLRMYLWEAAEKYKTLCIRHASSRNYSQSVFFHYSFLSSSSPHQSSLSSLLLLQHVHAFGKILVNRLIHHL